MVWGIEAKGGTLQDYLEGKGRVPAAIVWEPNRRSTLQHLRRDCSDISTASASCSYLRTLSVKALHAGLKGRRWTKEVKATRLLWGYVVFQRRAACIMDACPPGWDRRGWEVGSRSEVDLA